MTYVIQAKSNIEFHKKKKNKKKIQYGEDRNHFYPVVLWSHINIYLQQDQVDLVAPLRPSDLLGPEEKKEKTHEDFLDIAVKLGNFQPMHLLLSPAFQHVHHQMPIQQGLSAFVYSSITSARHHQKYALSAFNLRALLQEISLLLTFSSG